MTVKYTPNGEFRRDITLVKSADSIAIMGNISETYGLEKDCEGHIIAHTVKGTHQNFIQGEGAKKVAELINDIFSE
ncbi:hypothetical protein NPIL_121421 [Nephila pilipes]|uniref:Uncharacterized protein n=1 Tax=Nephila pilipes TaxID=299642 RepID=A0A8X6NZD7_NEPPI|nr:hypothetical protein NPIL_121421 [Nephila pilipes]